ncbi:MAG: LCP family protein [Candidatus Peribacter sp.]|jgi:LCP family protein required for cell wall assembly|nr:LCP family protein [Candidatus Peribacter sp.]MBT4600778.1 LCP family protein [Candidatus Peribacter sp.]MBT5149176.1 LCP family protein [Candidatus Peribacter sp.]MBT5637851.1 LCP family protein [Candidatus Peribacter sp.]MBT5937993.1 LCP family protein [Candidatus Peribacter sp.]
MSFSVRKLRDKPSATTVWAGRAAALLTVAQPVMGLYHHWKRRHNKEMKKEHRLGVLKRTLTILIAVFVALLLLAGIGKAMMSVRSLGVSNIINIAGASLPKDERGFTNFLLMGQGHADHDGKNLTDTIMIASIDPTDTQSAVLLSLPRDTYFLKTEKMGKGRLNTMYRDFRSYLIFQKGVEPEIASKETLEHLAQEIGNKLGIEIHHTVKVDFIAFTRAVDILGGVDIDVPYDIEDNEYPDENFGFDPFVIRAGPRHLDGATALKYARSRHTSSDFGRSARQQQLLGAMTHKAKEEGVLSDAATITSFMKIMSENVETTMTLRELIGAAELGQKLNRENIISMQLNDRNALYDYIIEPGGMLYTPPRNLFEGASVLLPVSLPEFPVTWKQPKSFAELLFRNRSIYLDKPNVAVLNAGAKPGSARKLATELTRFGFTVVNVENGDTEKRESSMIITPPEPDPVITFFSTLLGIEATSAPLDLPTEQRERATIILGKDYRFTPLQNLVPNLVEDDS